jgi:hypothetical protein
MIIWVIIFYFMFILNWDIKKRDINTRDIKKGDFWGREEGFGKVQCTGIAGQINESHK